MSMWRVSDTGSIGPRGCSVLIAALLLSWLMSVSSADTQPSPQGLPKVGDVVPDLKFASVEGMPVALRPPTGKLLCIYFWNIDYPSSGDRAKAAIVLHSRFHAKGLNALTVSGAGNDTRALQFAETWNLPWPMILDKAVGSPLGKMGISKPPFSMIVDSQGRILATNLEDEPAHAKVADLLGVKLADLPMPSAPEPRKIRKSAEAYSDDRDLVHGNAKVYVAATPLGPDRIELVWSARGLPGGAGHWKDNYAVFIADQHELFAPYQAELQVAHDYRKTWHKIAEIPAGEQKYVWQASPAGTLLWYRVVLRNSDGKIAAVSDVVAGVTGENLISHDDSAPSTVPPATQPAGWVQASRTSTQPAGQGDTKPGIVEQNRPFSSGKHCMELSTEKEFTMATALIPTQPDKNYWMGAWIRVTRGMVSFERAAFNSDKRCITLAETVHGLKASDWMFCAHRLDTKGDLKGDPEKWTLLDPELAGQMPANQAFLRPQLSLYDAACLLGDSFLIEYTQADESVLLALPAVEKMKADPAAADDFAARREAALDQEEESERN